MFRLKKKLEKEEDKKVTSKTLKTFDTYFDKYIESAGDNGFDAKTNELFEKQQQFKTY